MSSTDNTLSSLAIAPYLFTFEPEAAKAKLGDTIQKVLINKAVRVVDRTRNVYEPASFTSSQTPAGWLQQYLKNQQGYATCHAQNRIFFPQDTGEQGAQVYFQSDSQSTHYYLSVRVGELFRRLLDNVKVLEEDTALVDIIIGLVPFEGESDSGKTY